MRVLPPKPGLIVEVQRLAGSGGPLGGTEDLRVSETNAAGPDYAKYLGEELVATIERIFPASRKRESRGVGGLSMGGYGAFNYATNFNDPAIAAISPR